MKKILWLIAFALILCQTQPVMAEGRLTKLNDKVYAYVGAKDMSPSKSYGANTGVVIGNNGILVIDTLSSTKEAKELIRDINQISNKPIKWVVNTHYHFDHTLGNSEFAKINAQIIASSQTSIDLKKKMQLSINNYESYGMTKEEIEGTEAAYPTITFYKKMTLDLGGLTAEIYDPGCSHTNGSSFVYLPDQKIIFAGDILFKDAYPYIGEGNIKEWCHILDSMRKFNANEIIPGHGPISTNKDLYDMKTFIINLDKATKKEICLTKNKNDTNKIVQNIIKDLPKRNNLQCVLYMNLYSKYLSKKSNK